MISLKNISRIYSRKQSNEDVVALDNINLTLPETGFISILGASGSGKTTLLNIIGGIDTPTSGNMIVDGLSTAEFKGKDWDAYRNEKIGFVLQNCFLLPHLSIKDNVAIKLQISSHNYQNIDEMVDDALKEVDLFERKNDKPKALSGGQRQRVAIARAIVGKPTVILADEPTGALDSKTGSSIMETLKRLSENHLVVMVTHNRDYADKYSDRIIELKDGKITSDTSPITKEVEITGEKMGKVAFPFFTSLKWGLKNLVLRISSTLAIIIATSLGLAGVGLILSISKGVESTFVQTEEKALSQYPVTVTSYSSYSYDGTTPTYVEFPDETNIIADLGSFATRDHRNFMSSNFLSYMNEMPESYYTLKYETSSLRINTLTKILGDETNYQLVTSPNSYFYKGLDFQTFAKQEYDCLAGDYPSSKYDVAIVIDKYNRIDAKTLQYLGFDVDTTYQHDVKFSFNDVIGKIYKYIDNNQIYTYDTTTETYKYSISDYETAYNNATISLRVSGILREKRDSNNPALVNGVTFSKEFAEYAVSKANESNVVIAQKEAKLTKNVRTGNPITDRQVDNITYKADYYYEGYLYELGAVEEKTRLQYFTSTFGDRNNIKTYFNNYVKDEAVDYTTLSFDDYLERVSFQFDGAISLMTGVLYVFAGVSVLVSAILNTILTYISVHQRTNEIGLLRSLGARRKDIGIMFETESFICGLIGSLLSILICVVFVQPINALLTTVIYRYKFYLLSNTTFTLPGFQWWVAPIMIGIGLATALLSALVPAIIASKKDPAHAISE